jgi:hypothetical protein
MAPHEILARVRRAPFEPFCLVLADGARYDIRYPDQCMVMKRDVVIGEADAAGAFIDWTIRVNCWNVRGIEAMPAEVVTAG